MKKHIMPENKNWDFKMQMREAIFEYLYDKFRQEKLLDSFILSNDFGAQKLDAIREKYPKQFINCGISEQNQIGVGAGMSKFGLTPIFYSIASFYMRAAEQIKVDIAVPNLKSIFLGVGAGYGYSADGPTHHSIEDIGLFNNFDEFDVIVPISDISAVQYFEDIILNRNKPVYLRLDRDDCLGVSRSDYGFHLISRNVASVKDKSKKLIITCGYLASICTEHFSGTNVDICIVEDFSAIKSGKLQKCVSDYSKIVIAEEHVTLTGLASLAFRDLNFENCAVAALGLNGPSRFGYNNRIELLRASGIDPVSIEQKLESL